MHTAIHALIWWAIVVMASTLLMYASVLVWLVPALAFKAVAALWRAVSN